MANTEVSKTLREAVDEVLGLLTGTDLQYDPSQERFHSIARCLNRALRSVALENEWSYYASTEEVGLVTPGTKDVELAPRLRPRIINDDAVRLLNKDGVVIEWAYFLPRDALHKYGAWQELRCAVTRTTITFSRPFHAGEAGLRIVVPVMREPRQIKLPETGQSFTTEQLMQLIDFDYPDLVIMRAAYFYAQTDPLMQPRVQTLEAQYKDMMYQLIERDERSTDTPYQNEVLIPMYGSLSGGYWPHEHQHPHANDVRF